MNITNEEFIALYGDVEVEFYSYYKYTFTYRGELPDGSVIFCDYGGNSDEVYRYEVNAGDKIAIKSVYPYAGRVIKDGEVVHEFYDY